jgi:hypothetical protein
MLSNLRLPDLNNLDFLWMGGLVIFTIIGLSFFIPAVSANYYVQQGDTIYLNTIVDISGVAPPYTYLAYWDGFDMYDSNATYTITLPDGKRGYYNFKVDPLIFGNRLGRWYKYDGVYEPNSNNMVFVVASKPAATNLSSNITLQNPNQTPIIIPQKPILPDKHIADYVVARGSNLSFPVNNTTNVWIFGAVNYLYDYHSINNSVNLQTFDIDRLSPGSYTMLLQTHNTTNTTGDFTVRYNPNTSMIDWFDPISFNVLHYDTLGQTPENVMNKLKEIIPDSYDTYNLLTLEVQLPSVTINQVDASSYLNSTQSLNSGVNLDSPSYIDVRGYTNAPPNTIIKLVVDPQQSIYQADQIFKDASITLTEGKNPGNLRTFRAIVPVNMYNMTAGKHFIAAKTVLSNSYTTAEFNIYENPAGNFIPNKTIRYISGRYGPDEIVPTPTPITVIHEVTKIVTQVVTVPVTPSNEQVYTQQKSASEKTWWEGFWFISKGIAGVILIIVGSIYVVTIIRRLKNV